MPGIKRQIALLWQEATIERLQQQGKLLHALEISGLPASTSMGSCEHVAQRGCGFSGETATRRIRHVLRSAASIWTESFDKSNSLAQDRQWCLHGSGGWIQGPPSL